MEKSVKGRSPLSPSCVINYPPEPHPKRGIRLVHRSGSLNCAGQTFPAPTIMVKVYFETSSTAEQVAIFDNEETYAACTPALEELMKKRGFEFMSESVEEGSVGRPLSGLPDADLLAELERRGYAVRETWSKADVQHVYEVSDDEAVEIMNAALGNEWMREQISQSIEEVASARGHECKD